MGAFCIYPTFWLLMARTLPLVCARAMILLPIALDTTTATPTVEDVRVELHTGKERD